jgi:hypothetical protein
MIVKGSQSFLILSVSNTLVIPTLLKYPDLKWLYVCGNISTPWLKSELLLPNRVNEKKRPFGFRTLWISAITEFKSLCEICVKHPRSNKISKLSSFQGSSCDASPEIGILLQQFRLPYAEKLRQLFRIQIRQGKGIEAMLCTSTNGTLMNGLGGNKRS